MKNRRKRGGSDVVVSWRRFFRFVALFVSSFVVFSALFIFLGKFRPVVRPSIKAVLGGSVPAVKVAPVHEAVKFPDQTLIFIKYQSSSRLLTKDDLFCVFSNANDSSKVYKELPSAVEINDSGHQIVRCSTVPRHHTVSLAVTRWTADNRLLVGPTYRWDRLVYDAVIDHDNTTVAFVKGLNLRPGKVADVSRYECVYGWDLAKPKLLLRSQVISAAQDRTVQNASNSVKGPTSGPISSG
ncbi:hypothetical protein Rs2_35430 [Raphanus sativus]|nr:hypothetical protein Rs2_35430 [Raphanus sativus]